jgi:deoxyribonuclease-4
MGKPPTWRLSFNTACLGPYFLYIRRYKGDDRMPPLGAHVSISGGVQNAPYNGKEATCDVVQIFTKSSNQWRAKPLTDEDASLFHKAQKETGVTVACAHDSYLINLASPDKTLFEKSYDAFLEEMRRCDFLGIANLVMHPGSHVGSGEAVGLKRIAESFNRMFAEDPNGRVTICLETTAGQGTNLGYRFEQLAEIIAQVDNKDRMGICLDTCHIFAAGYPISTEADYRATMKEFDSVLGFDRLRIIHMNDSMKGPGSRVDRHQHIGDGEIGRGVFGYFLNDRRLAKIPMILETPKESAAEDIANLKILRSLYKGKKGSK